MVKVIKRIQLKENKERIVLSEETFTALLTLMHTTAYTNDYVVFVIGEEIRMGEDILSTGLFLYLAEFTFTDLVFRFTDTYNDVLSLIIDFINDIIDKPLQPVGWFLIRPHEGETNWFADGSNLEILTVQASFQNIYPHFFCLIGTATSNKTENFHVATVTAYRKIELCLEEVAFVIIPFRFKNFFYGSISLAQIYLMLQRRIIKIHESRTKAMRSQQDVMQRYKYQIEATDSFVNVCNRFVFPALQYCLRYLDIMQNYTFYMEAKIANKQLGVKEEYTKKSCGRQNYKHRQPGRPLEILKEVGEDDAKEDDVKI